MGKGLPEITIKAVILSIILAIVLGAANAYLGLFIGMTVSASIPAAVVSLGVLKLFKKSNILENNIVQTAASSGEGVTAGIIFTIPALVLMGYWTRFNVIDVTIIAALGGFLGVLFTIPLRRALIVESPLKYPEGIATAAVLRAAYPDNEGGEDVKTKKNVILLVFAALLGGGLKLLADGLNVWQSEQTGAVSVTKNAFCWDISFSPALLAVGYIVGLNAAFILFLGSAIIWWFGVPFYGHLWLGYHTIDADAAMNIWKPLRYVAIGLMISGAIYSIFKLMKPMMMGIKSSIKSYSNVKNGVVIRREEKDIPMLWVLILIVLSIIPLCLFFSNLTGHGASTLSITIIIIVLAFLFSSMGAYIVGIVGSSNNPNSSVAIATIIITTIVLLFLLGKHSPAVAAGAILVGAVIASAEGIAGDNMQDLKAGYLVGATPWKQQVMQMVGTLAAALAVGWTLNILNAAYHLGSSKLPAPQAVLMKSIVEAIQAGKLPWGLLILGFILGIITIIIDIILEKKKARFRLPTLALGLGAYLPMYISLGIFIGGIIAWCSSVKNHHKTETQKGILFASGLIAGEALMGVIIAIPIFVTANANWWPNWHLKNWIGVIVYLVIIYLMYKMALMKKIKEV